MLKLNCLPLDAEYSLESNELWAEGGRRAVQARSVKEMTDVLADGLFASKANPSDSLYYMFRGSHRQQDASLFQKNNIRCDVTAMPARSLGREFVKTFGHYHPLAPGSGHAFPELYEVLSGQAWYLLQKRKGIGGGSKGGENHDGKSSENNSGNAIVTNEANDDEIEEAWLVEAEAGEKVLMPPDYGHLTINPSPSEALVMANLVQASFKSDYAPYKERHGGAYYLMAEGGVEKNLHYAQLPELKRTTAREFWGNKKGGIEKMEKNVYAEFVEKPEAFSFLREPGELF